MGEEAYLRKLDEIVGRYVEASQWPKYAEEALTIEGARVYVQQHGIFTRASRQHWAFVVGDCPIGEVRWFIEKENLYEEEAIPEQSHFQWILKMGRALGMSDAEVINATPLVTTRVSLHVWENLTKNRPWWIGLAAKAVLERVNAPHCGAISARMAESWKRHLGLPEDALTFWTRHHVLDQVHAGGAYDFLVRYVSAPEQWDDITRAAEESMLAFQIFWDGIVAAVRDREGVPMSS
jgi:pyrroloquinoline quinone (PQQ) biosynthesis protein C